MPPGDVKNIFDSQAMYVSFTALFKALFINPDCLETWLVPTVHSSKGSTLWSTTPMEYKKIKSKILCYFASVLCVLFLVVPTMSEYYTILGGHDLPPSRP